MSVHMWYFVLTFIYQWIFLWEKDDWQSRWIKALILPLVSWPSSFKCIVDYRMKWHMPLHKKRLSFLDKPVSGVIHHFVTHNWNTESLEVRTARISVHYLFFKLFHRSDFLDVCADQGKPGKFRFPNLAEAFWYWFTDRKSVFWSYFPGELNTTAIECRSI